MGPYDWEIRDPDSGATGHEIARGRCDTSDQILAHDLPGVVDVRIWNRDGELLATGEQLDAGTQEFSPVARLRNRNGTVTRENVWPSPDDLGHYVILPGGEIGTLISWWNSPEHDEWRWRVELHNQRKPVAASRTSA